ncbi:MAG: D-aminoacyl-tRNA deacylase [Humidesulfovibrio sp.]|uniref:D-aminoacyl-tRNA deacylase n=1 Tax=Humidesulfovibrio sp. TaxID=2910988 RepID=UPI0027329C1C|nr:D-aminoacyl-tRNA deacylase [Humidesulfovibrio sp.]MDP2847691.1 D-aminoacyl-tRNA deacylase [Humidesulfovibrio sp.]
MRLLLQRVSRAAVDVDGERVGEIGQGLLLLAGFGKADGPDLPETRVWTALCAKVLELRIFPDEAGKLNLSLKDLVQSGQDAGLLLVSQFTLYADTRRGRRPSFTDAAPPDVARALYDRLAVDLSGALEAIGPARFGQGVFGAEMRLDFVNWGPVTILLDSADFAGV